MLNCIEWKNFRDKIILRDRNECKVCSSRGSERVGNKYYRDLTERELKESYERYLKSIEDSEFFTLKYARPLATVDENPVILNVHHTYYIKNHLPWDYPSDSLITVCEKCHKDIHANTEIKVYKNDLLMEAIKISHCKRCNGTGFVSEFYYHREGICFTCNGNGYCEVIE